MYHFGGSKGTKCPFEKTSLKMRGLGPFWPEVEPPGPQIPPVVGLKVENIETQNVDYPAGPGKGNPYNYGPLPLTGGQQCGCGIRNRIPSFPHSARGSVCPFCGFRTSVLSPPARWVCRLSRDGLRLLISMPSRARGSVTSLWKCFHKLRHVPPRRGHRGYGNISGSVKRRNVMSPRASGSVTSHHCEEKLDPSCLVVGFGWWKHFHRLAGFEVEVIPCHLVQIHHLVLSPPMHLLVAGPAQRLAVTCHQS